MSNTLEHTLTGPVELEPWLILLGTEDNRSLALWRLESRQEDTLALFSDLRRAEAYAQCYCQPCSEVYRFDRNQFISVLVDCFRQGIRLATLDPSDSAARQVFSIRDVLKAARVRLENERQTL
jgi:hypothetical protein